MPDHPRKSDALEAFKQGATHAETAERYDLRPETVRKWFAEWRRYNVAAPVAAEQTKAEAQDMEVAALKERLRQLGAAPERAPSIPRHIDETDWGEVWARAEIDNARRIEADHQRRRFDLTVPESKPVAFVFISDNHISAGNVVDLKRMREDAELLARTDGCYAFLGGDFADNHIKIRAATLASRSQPSDQWRLVEHYLAIFAHRIAAMCSGNHDAWTDQIAGIDVLQRIAQDQKLCYAPYEARIYAKVGAVDYRIAMRHQYRFGSSFNPCHCVKQWFRMGPEDFDIGCIGHEHEPCVEAFMGHGEYRWACRPGAYQIASGYSNQFGWNPTRPTCPTFVVYPDTRRIVGFWDVREGLTYLKAVRA